MLLAVSFSFCFLSTSAYLASLISSQLLVWQFMKYDIHDFLWAVSNKIPYVAMKEGLVVGMRKGYDKTTIQNDYIFVVAIVPAQAEYHGFPRNQTLIPLPGVTVKIRLNVAVSLTVL